MTCYLHHEGRYYADGVVVKGEEKIVGVCKIRRLLDPLYIHLKGDEGQEPKIDDVVYGWFGTGVQHCMERFVESLIAFPGDQAHIPLASYRMAAAAELVNSYNEFEIVLVGKKFDHRFQFYPQYFQHSVFEKYQTYCLGGGGPLAFRFLEGHMDPIRAILETSMVDDNTGGPIDVWALDTKEGDPDFRIFRRVGLHDEIPPKLVSHYLHQLDQRGLDKVRPTLLRESELTKILLAQVDEMEKEAIATETASPVRKKPVTKPAVKRTRKRS